MYNVNLPRASAIAMLLFSAAACGGSGETPATDSAQQPAAPASAAPTAGTELVPDPEGQIIKVEMATNEQGNNVFTPAEVKAKKGDVIRFTLVSGVHNVHFLPDSNATAQGLPTAPSDMLQLPGQTVDVKVASPPGRYYFQCDPHALLGMKGYLVVQ